MRIWGSALRHHAQFAHFAGAVELHTGLFQNPRFNALMVHAQQVKGAHGVMLFCRGARLVAHDLGHYTSRDFQPLGQALETAVQTMNSQPVNSRHCTSVVMWVARYDDATIGVCSAGKNKLM